MQGRRKVWKSGGHIILGGDNVPPLVEIGLADLPKSGGPPACDGPDMYFVWAYLRQELSTDLSRSSLLLRWIKSKMGTQSKTDKTVPSLLNLIMFHRLLLFTCSFISAYVLVSTRHWLGGRSTVLFWREKFPFDRNVYSLPSRNLSKMKAFSTLSSVLVVFGK